MRQQLFVYRLNKLIYARTGLGLMIFHKAILALGMITGELSSKVPTRTDQVFSRQALDFLTRWTSAPNFHGFPNARPVQQPDPGKNPLELA